MKRSTLVTMVVALMVGAGLAGYFTGKHGDTLTAPSKTPAVATAPGPTAPTPVTDRRPATPAPAAAGAAFAYRRLSIDSSRPEGEACLSFTKPLAGAERVKYDDFIELEPAARVAVRAADNRLCLAGLAYGTTYTVTLKPGLPAADGAKIEDEEKVEVALGARPPVVSLGAKGFILPRGSSAGLPVTSVNVSKVGIAVYRVNERGLDRFTRSYYAGFPENARDNDWYTLRQWLSGESGAELWRGTMDVRNVQNQPVTTAFPLRETIKEWKPGAYYVVVWNAARDVSVDDYDRDSAGEMAGQWVVDTDIALTSFTGTDGLTVFARSLDNAKPIAGLEVVLLSRGNDQIGRVTTDQSGRVNFAAGLMKGRGASEPVAVMAFDAARQEFSRLELTKAAFDLSDRGIEGREPPGPVDAFLYTERGVYRPGETVHMVALLRDQGAAALRDLPVTLIVKRPDGSEFQRIASGIQAGGSVTQAIALPKSSRRGRWSIAAYIDPKGSPVGRVEFSVEDFVPEKLKIELGSDEPLLRVGKPNWFTISADFLYGAPGSGLTTEADLRIVVDSNPFPNFARYVFGPEKERTAYEGRMISAKPPETDAAGKARFEWQGGDVKDTVLPLRAHITARVFEPGGGRSTKADKTLPLRTRDAYIGIRPSFEGRYAREGTEVAFEVVAVDAAGKQIALKDVGYTIERISHTYQWYQVEGRWRWQSVSNERIVTNDGLDLPASAPGRISRKLGWGMHRLTVAPMGGDDTTRTTTSVTFYVGYYGGSGERTEEAPDTLKVASDKQSYAPGEVAKLRIEAPFAGEALIALATDSILATYAVAVTPGGTTVEIPTKAEWGAGTYALVTAYRPLAAPAERTPVRAIGAVWLGLDPKLRTLGVQIGAPEKMVPRQKIEVPIQVTNRQGGDAFVTLAAVDEGILQLTRYRTPQPADHYFGKRKLTLSIADDYGRLLDTNAEDVGRIRSGGDAGDIGGLDVVPTRTVALFSGPVKLDAEGRARIAIDVPDFIGQLRLMAVAFDATRVGSAEQRLFVRDAVTSDVILPRFLSPGDDGRLAVSLHNVEGAAGDYRLTVEASGAVALAQPVAETRRLAANQREVLSYMLQGREIGFGKVALTLAGPNNFSVRREWNIQVRSPQTPTAVDTVATLEPGREATVDREVIAGFAAGTGVVSVALSRTPGIDVPGLLRALDKYPYGCLEQTTSRAMPLLYFNDVALLGYGPADPKIEDRVQDAIWRIIDMQSTDGSFGMWGPYATPAAEWLQVYALDFLVRARERQMAVPQASLQRALAFLNRAADKFAPNSQAYAWYVLAKAGLADPGRVRYFQDSNSDRDGIKGGLAWAQLAAALNLVGEPGRARLALIKAQQQIDQRDTSDYYGSALRDRAAILALAPEAGGREAVTMVMGSVRERLTVRVRESTTQEQAWLLLAARALGGGGELAYALNGESRKAPNDPVVINPDAASLARGLRLRNEGTAPIWLQVTARGVPRDPQAAGANGLAVQRQFLTLDGKPADLAAVRQNDRFIVSIVGRRLTGAYHELALLDLLPAGFEIESVINEETQKAYARFLPKITSARIAEGRDDRFFAAFDLGRSPYDSGRGSSFYTAFHVAYVVRAVTPGTFALPAVQVEDMYAPRFFARSAMGRVIIAPR